MSNDGGASSHLRAMRGSTPLPVATQRARICVAASLHPPQPKEMKNTRDWRTCHRKDLCVIACGPRWLATTASLSSEALLRGSVARPAPTHHHHSSSLHPPFNHPPSLAVSSIGWRWRWPRRRLWAKATTVHSSTDETRKIQVMPPTPWRACVGGVPPHMLEAKKCRPRGISG